MEGKCQEILDLLKNKMVTKPILVFPELNKEFHVHVDVLYIALKIVLMHPGKGSIDHLVAFASRKLSATGKNYSTTKREGLVMVYALQKF